ncbi:integration host factor subunit alpha [Thermodesulfobacteriota bacterium]
MTVTRAHINKAIRDELGYTNSMSAEVVETIMDLIKQTLESGEDVLISGFGKFRVKEKRERRGRNPATEESLMLAPRRVVTFKCSGKLRDKMNGKG